MKLRYCAIVVLVLLGTGGVTRQAAGQNLPVTATAIGPAETKTIDDFVKAQAAKLAGADAAAQKEAREALINALNSTKDTTAAFIDAYAASINTHLGALANNNTMRARLNAAIVIAEVARRAQNTTLAPAVTAYLKDPKEPVVILALQAAQPTVTAIFRNPLSIPGNTVVPAVVASVKAHPSGLIAEEAYDAMSVDLLANNPAGRPTPTMLGAALPVMQQLLQLRLDAYQSQWPGDPGAEGPAVSFLAHPQVWRVAKPNEQLQSVQQLSNLLNLAAQHAAAHPEKRGELMPIINRSASALSVIGGFVGAPNVAAAAVPLQVTNYQNSIPTDAAALHKALTTVPAFSGLKAPPTIGKAAAAPITTLPTNGATTAPATAPAP